jgi:protein-tyrosine phosphatase
VADSNPPALMVDIHTHIIPGVDDGAQNMEDTIAMCRLAAEDGVGTIVATPHAYWSREVNGGPVIENGTAAVREALEANGVSMKIVPGCEVPMERNLVAKLLADRFWTIDASSAYLLLEPPWGALPDYLYPLIQEILDQGITPIIAHPERSPDLQQRPQIVARLVEMGSLTQLTANSILGRHGPKARDVAWRLLEEGLAHVVASDSHNSTSRPPRLSEARREVEDALGADVGVRLFEENPQQIVSGMPVMAAPKPNATPDRGRQTGLGGFFQRLRGN